MTDKTTDRYSAGEQALGYIYQARLALLHLLQLPEETAISLEKDDDLEFIDGGGKSLASLKHKAIGDRLTDLSTDFWKSINIWLARYKRDGCAASNLRFFLFTTGMVSTDSFLARFLPDQPVASEDVPALATMPFSNIVSAGLLKSSALDTFVFRACDVYEFQRKFWILPRYAKLHAVSQPVVRRALALENIKPIFGNFLYEQSPELKAALRSIRQKKSTTN